MTDQKEQFADLLSPLKVGPIELRNRVLITAHVPGLEQGGIANDAFIAYQRARAHGGAALQISGASAVHWSGSVGTGRGLDCTAPGSVDAYKKLADAIHSEGGRFLIQLGHSAATVNIADAGKPLWAPSAISSELHREIPKEMTRQDIAEVVEAHRSASKRVREGGLDGVEILAAFGFLVAAFLSPYSNKRNDEYGGSLQNRLRFALEVIDAVRDGAGPDLIVGMRIPGDERIPGSLTPDDMSEIAQHLSATGKIDYLNVIVGTNYNRIERMEHWPPTPARHGLYVPLAEAIKHHVDIPVFTTGRITDPRMANDIIRDGKADMVGMTRAHLSDPDLVAKISTGRAEELRPCVGANLCIAQATEGKPVRCFHNADTAREATWGPLVPAAAPKHVVVIGGGPAGMEAARVAASRGHRVSLYEQEPEVGGQLKRWAQAPLTAEFNKTITWLSDELRRAQVRVITGETIHTDDIDKLGADAVILATGSRPGPCAPIDGTMDSSIDVMNTWEVMENNPTGKHVMLWDEGGGRGGLSAVDYLLDNNRITIVTSQPAIGELINPNIRTPLYKRFLGAGAEMRANEAIVRLDAKTVVTRNIYSETENRIDGIDLLVNWQGNAVHNDLVHTVTESGIPYHIIGDVMAPRQVHIAIAEGAMAGRVI